MKTLTDSLTEMLAYYEACGRAPGTLRMLRHCVGHTLRWLAEHEQVLQPDQLNRQHLERWSRQVRARRTAKGLPLQLTSISKHFETSRVFIKWLEKNGALPAGLNEVIPQIKLPQLLPTSVLTHEQMDQLLQSTDITTNAGFQLRAMQEFLYTSGVRVAELLSLNLDMIDLDARTARIFGKGQKERMVPFGATAAEFLEAYLAGLRPLRLSDPFESALWLDRFGQRMPYDNGKRVSVGVSTKGKIWSRSTSSIPDWRNWCEMIASRILDKSLPTDDYLKHTLMPTEIAQLPATAVFSVALPAEWFSDELDTAAIVADGKKFSLDQVGVEAWSTPAGNIVAFELVAVGGFTATFHLQWGPANGQFVVIQQAGPTVELHYRGNSPRFDDYLKESPPTVFLADGSEVEGGLLKSPRDKLVHSLDLTQLEPWDWTGVSLEVESMWKHGTRRADSIQERVMSVLSGQGNSIVFDDDDAGESADVIEVIERSDEILFRFYHCKYSGAAQPGERAKDLYEVCGQAVRSTRWHSNPTGLVDHLHRRSLPAGRNGRTSRFAKGDERSLVQLKRKVRQLRCRYEVVVVQPGIAKAKLEPETSSILGAANHFLLEMTGAPLRAVVSP